MLTANDRIYELIPELIDYVLEHNYTQAVYHNKNHLLGVANLCCKLATELNLSEIDIKELTIAGLLHDYCYGWFKEDLDNINHTIKRIGFIPDTLFNGVDKERIIQLIQSTLYPHEKTSVAYADIIRDADILYSVVYPSYESINGAYHDFGQFKTNLSYDKWIFFNIKYLNNLNDSFKTTPAIKLYNDNLSTAIARHLKEVTNL